MTYDGELDIAIGLSARSKVWSNKKLKWSELVSRLGEENKTTETFKEFVSASKEDQLKIKDVGGYVGGYLRGGKRSPANVVHRQLMTLDLDFAHKDLWDDFTLQFDNAAVLHGTHKHSDASPRYRLIMPLSREVTADEYVAISRKIAGIIGIDLFDNSTFETNRLMFWPSTPKDMDYYFRVQDGPWIDADEVLNSYADWKDSSLWPTASSRFEAVDRAVKKQEDPTIKRGLIGAFCRTYSIPEAIETFLSDTYVPSALEDRYTYTKGSASAGLIVYEDKFAYSHHGTDPCGGKLCNAFDLVRIHKFGHLDDKVKDPSSKLPSVSAMEEFVRNDPDTKTTIANDHINSAKYEFADPEHDRAQEEVVEKEVDPEAESVEWMKELEVDTRGAYLSSDANLNLIFANDLRFKRLFRQNDFDGKRYVFGNLPWRRVVKPEPVKNVDYSGVRNYLGCVYGITSSLKIDDAMALEFERNHFHPILDYLNGLKWDGIQRVDKLLIDYMGADDNIYSREAIRKMLVGAVARVMNPGVKFDLVLMLVGPQGSGKSTFIKKLGKSWFSDTFLTVQGKEALEQIQGAWLIEIAELSGLRKAEVESVKHFISKSEDSFRPAYARTSEIYPRQCVFFGTTNDSEFLRDPTGNRRFMPVDVVPNNAKKDVFMELDDEIDQIWAEAVVLYKSKEKLYLSHEAEKIAKNEQSSHSESDERKGIIEAYLERKLPDNWDSMDLYQRRDFLADELNPKGTTPRDYVCVAEIWCECLGRNREDMDRYKTREINDLLKSMPEWEPCKSTKNFPIYGKQKYYVRKLD